MTTPEQPPRPRPNLRSVLDIVATLAMIAAAGAIIWTTLGRSAPTAARPGRAPIPVPTEPVPLEGAPILGNPEAPVAIVEFSDFACPFCGRFSKDILPELKAKYIDTGQVLLAFRHLPLDRIHPRARPAAEAAECASRQGKFWRFHDLLFADLECNFWRATGRGLFGQVGRMASSCKVNSAFAQPTPAESPSSLATSRSRSATNDVCLLST